MGRSIPSSGDASQREKLDEALVAAVVLCLESGETEAAEHVLEALRSLYYKAANDMQ